MVLANAYKMAESHHRTIHKILTYPLIVLAATGSVLAGLHSNEYVLMGISLATLIMTGFSTAINPKDKEMRCYQVSAEFNEIAGSINQFILENHKSREEIKAFSKHILSVLDIWRALAPSINKKYVRQAKIECAPRTRTSQKKSQTLDSSV